MIYSMGKRNGAVTKPHLQEELGKLEQRLDGKFDTLRKDLLGMKDEIVKEIKDMRDEFDTHQTSHSRINDEIENHEERITSLEQKPL